MIMKIRAFLLVWLIAFSWWCVRGASWFFVRKDFDEPATWVGPLSVPWLVLGVIAGGVAVWKPVRWTVGVFGLVTLIQVGLVFVSW